MYSNTKFTKVSSCALCAYVFFVPFVVNNLKSFSVTFVVKTDFELKEKPE